MNFSESMCGLAADMVNLSRATGSFGWDRGPDELFSDPKNLGAKPIPKNEWLRAMETAVSLCRANPKAGKPTPGADPEGFIWLTWERGSNRFSLAVKKGVYAWERRDSFGAASHSSQRIEDVSEALRASMQAGA
jgi:hypothetical protein